jgi:glycosyltransferase involved in cell wall biosynthesis
LKIKSKILIVTPHLNPFPSGSGRNALEFSIEIARKGFPVRILTFSGNSRVSVAGNILLQVKAIPISFGNLLARRLSSILLLPRSFFLFLNSSIIVVFGSFPGYLLLLCLARILNKRTVFRSTLNGADDILTLSRNQHLRKFLLKNIDLYYATNPLFKKKYINVFPNRGNKILELSSGVSSNWIFDGSKKTKDGEPITLISIGNLIDRKGYIPVFNALSKVRVNFVYIVIGECSPSAFFSDEENKQITHNHSYGKNILGSKVKFTGFVENVKDYLEKADLFILNSTYEGIPNSLLQAMACGVVPIISKLDGISDYIVNHRKNGIVISDAIEIPSWINTLLNDTTLMRNLSEESRQTIINNHRMERVVSTFIDRINR